MQIENDFIVERIKSLPISRKLKHCFSIIGHESWCVLRIDVRLIFKLSKMHIAEMGWGKIFWAGYW